ncbi:ABC transporter substrate-binding protein [Pseudacidovorax sp. RU35E]|uniref:ABC transporter substrate-binding protein n=1 Tax=Pseudacidovorax sp. RU35E TaxID=1907403 RepID=UPI000954EF6E|nr:ABC transporter substrate-binding protein [Pseudacidovorax sp. RU35E]SIR62898.1 amino acid/amide ABC transporter substrate-binding protein, HAAT family [Pseudacidovorax sp. RU35E]
MTTMPTSLRRRRLVQGLAASPVLGLPALARAQQGKTIRIGYISPLTGPLAPFGETDKYTVARIQALLKDGLTINGTRHPVEILVRDSQSNPNKAAELAGNLILNEKVALMLPASTTDAINPVADQCELNGVPCLSSQAPWQSFVFPRGGSADKPFKWTYHFFWGLEDVLATFTSMWGQVETNRKVGMLFPRNADGEAWGNKEWGLPPAVSKAGFQTVIPSSFQPLTNDFSAQIAEFKKNGVEIVGGITYPVDLKTFITQSRQQQFKPKVVTVAAALLFPSGVESMGDLGNGMSTEVWWTPAFPFKSSLTGETGQKLAADWEAEMKKQWTQPLGYAHALWEVALDALKRAKDPTSREAIRQAITETDLTTMAGPIKFKGGPTPNICKTPIVGGQWVRGQKYRYDLKIVDNVSGKLVPVQGNLQPIQG